MHKLLFAGLKRVDPFAVAAVILPLFVYLLTLAPSVTFFDSGEFVTAIYSLGSAHSPGYPLFINYAKPFTYLPFGNIAFRVNIATALSAAGACYGVYLLTSHMLAAEEMVRDKVLSAFCRRVVPLSAALSFAFSDRLWLQSNHDKPYPLIAFLSAMIFYLLLVWRDSNRGGKDHPAYLYLGGFFWGLAFGAHQTMVLLLPSFAFLILATDWRLLCRLKEMTLIVAWTLIGLSIHLHLPVRAMRNPLLNWGDPKTLTQFLWHFLRRGYPSVKPERGISLIWAQMNAFNIPSEFTLLGMALLLLGAYAFRKKRRDELLAYLIGIVFFLLVIVGYLNTQPDLIFLTEEFFTPLYLFSAMVIGLGLFYLMEKGLSIFAPKKQRTIPMLILREFPFLILMPLFLPITLCALHYEQNDQHMNYIAYDYANNTLRTLPERAIFYTWGDSGAFPLWYLQGVERMREDVPIVHTPHLVFPWYLDTFPELFGQSVLRMIPLDTQTPENVLKMAISEQINYRPIYIDFSTRYSVSFTDFLFQQRGICYHLEKGNSDTLLAPDMSVWGLYSLRGLTGGMFFRDLDTSKAILIYAYSHMEAGDTLMSLGRYAQGISELRIAEKIAPELREQVEMKLGSYGIR
jgi:LPXTG-motif cell wall-anchored protein